VIRCIFGADDYLKNWAAKRIGIEGFGPSVAIGVQADDEIIAAAVYHDLRDGQIEASIAASSRRWATRSVLHTLFAYPFLQVGANRLLVTCSEANEKAMKMNSQLGFVQEGRLRQMYAPHDAAIWGMLKQECKWLKGNDYGQKRTRTATNA
jgi:RimJ/RimL family protein N-acetyltransferase